mmetsp:Transcript_47433/g.78694  ORF Transcript_47433/g.78694 Transcript_47433/m.78694 type:complete len:535 (+) Transcript_47433:435-2039(+)
MMKLALEDSYRGDFPTVFAIPYPTWFRYYPSLEPSGTHSRKQATISVSMTSYRLTPAADEASCVPSWVGNLTSRVSAACDGLKWCRFFVIPEENKSGGVTDAKVDACPVQDVSGTYTCGDDSPVFNFTTNPGEVATGRPLVLSCHPGPRWLSSPSSPVDLRPAIQSVFVAGDKPSSRATDAPDNETEVFRGPIASVIGSVQPQEYSRQVIHKMCRERPRLCVSLSTGDRTNYSKSLEGRISDMYQLVMASTFCINPPGDSPTRKGLFDSLVLGCIPVVFTEESLRRYHFHLPFWRSVSVLVTTDQLFAEGFNLFDYLQAYTVNEPLALKQKQRAIQRAAYSLQYSLQPAWGSERGPDAFDLIIQNLLALTSTSSNTTSLNGTASAVNPSVPLMLLAPAGANNLLKSFPMNRSLRAVNSTDSAESVWRLEGHGDGSCCYRIVNGVTGKALYDRPSAVKETRVVVGSGRYSYSWGADQWRLAEQGDSTFTITNVASGRQLFADEGQQRLRSFGARLTPRGLADQKWEIVAQGSSTH